MQLCIFEKSRTLRLQSSTRISPRGTDIKDATDLNTWHDKYFGLFFQMLFFKARKVVRSEACNRKDWKHVRRKKAQLAVAISWEIRGCQFYLTGRRGVMFVVVGMGIPR